jgi:hypothetical protein
VREIAQRRMFSLKVVDTDLFLEMPVSARLLYYDLNMRADDDGFVASPKKIQRMIGCSDDDLKILIAKQLIIPFETGICVVKHWKVHNYIQKDRYEETRYLQEKSSITVDITGVYNVDTKCIQNSNILYPQVRLGKDRLEIELGKDSVVEEPIADKPPPIKRFIIPTIEEIFTYCIERNNGIDADKFFDYYISNGWMVGKNKMKDWKATVRNWEKRQNDKPKSTGASFYDL